MAVRKFADATGITELWSKVKSYISGVLPTKTSDLTNDSGYITGMEILSYGISTWDDFTDAYNAKKVVYCRASSNSNPASGSQTRLAFMAYVNNAATPTEVEFQYYRSINSHTVSQQGDQVFVYKLTSANKWTVITREAASKVAAGGDLTRSYSNGTVTISGTIPTVPTNVSAFTNDAGYITGYTETDPIFAASAAYNISNSDITNWNNKSDFSGDYNDLSNKPTIPTVPTNVSAFTNDAGYITGYTETDPIFTASAAHGISSSDITNWNGKQAALVSGTNIKTVNSTSLLGSGNVAVQPTLVSGTNIKTVNNNSLLGSGDLPIPAGTPATVTQISLAVANWNATTTCTKSVTGVTTLNSIIVSPAPESIPDYVASGVYCYAQAEGELTFNCTTTPSADLVVNIMIVG